MKLVIAITLSFIMGYGLLTILDNALERQDIICQEGC